MRKTTVVCIVLLLLVGTCLAPAQQRRGDFELQFYGMYFRTMGTDLTFANGTIGGKIGPYITDHLQIGIGPSLSISTISGREVTGYDPRTFSPIYSTSSTTTTTFGTSVFLIYSFLTSGGKVVPYFGAQWFKSDFNKPISEDKGSAGLTAGLKYFFARKTALDFSVNYGWNLNTAENNETLPSTLMFAFGLSFLI